MSTINEKERSYISFLRGLAVFLMVWGHCIQNCGDISYIEFCNAATIKVIYSFHMPLFMLISGFLFYYSAQKRNLDDLLWHKIKSLMQPLIMCTIFSFFVYKIYNIIVGNDSILSIFSGEFAEKFFLLWFIVATLLSSIWVAIVEKKINNKFLKMFFFLFGFIFLLLFPNRDYNLFLYPYFVLGFLYSKYKNRIDLSIIFKILKYSCILLFPVMVIFYDFRHYIYNTGIFPFYIDGEVTNKYSMLQSIEIDVFRYLIGLVGSVFFIVIVKFAFDKLYEKKMAVTTLIIKIGNYSLQFYCLSGILMGEILGAILNKFHITYFICSNILIYCLIWSLIIAIIWSIGTYYYTKLLYKIKIGSILFGR